MAGRFSGPSGLGLALGLLALTWAVPTWAKTPWEELFGPGKPTVWGDPAGRFTIDLPLGWEAETQGAGQPVHITKRHPDYGITGWVTVVNRTLPPGTALRHFETHVDRETRDRSPGYELVERSVREGPGRRAVWRYFLYRERGNAELMREAVQVLTLSGERAFIITLRTPYGQRAPFWEDFKVMMEGFHGRAPGEESWDKPKKRRKIREGEMIHPDAIGY